jgi:hypothetical protein
MDWLVQGAKEQCGATVQSSRFQPLSQFGVSAHIMSTSQSTGNSSCLDIPGLGPSLDVSES